MTTNTYPPPPNITCRVQLSNKITICSAKITLGIKVCSLVFVGQGQKKFSSNFKYCNRSIYMVKVSEIFSIDFHSSQVQIYMVDFFNSFFALFSHYPK